MDASCGPSSALSQLSKHAQRDTSLQHGLVNRNENQQNRQGGFRNQPGFDNSLNQEFQNFSGRTGGAPMFQDQFAGAGPIHPQQQHHQQHHRQPQQGQNQQNRWIQDFNGLSIDNRQTGQQGQHGQQGKSDWHRQFMNQQNVQHQAQPQLQHNMTNYQMGSMGQMGHMGQMGQYRYQGAQAMNSPQNQKAQVEADLLENSEALDSHFDQLEKELAMEEQVDSEEASISEIDKEQFVKAARDVQRSMRSEKNQKSDETTSKFEQSNFLKLMNSISDRKVELSQQGDKLVETASGEDIRKHLSDPLKYEKDPNYHQQPHEAQTATPAPIPSVVPNEPQVTRESENVQNHLPDPLAHIKDGQLPDNLSALQAAKIISGGQVNDRTWMEDESWLSGPSYPAGVASGMSGGLPSGNSSSGNSIMEPHWQEVYDDYRHDDDYH
ncbi:hypothetical protein FT663_00689 [Candidozyma haemuli var. vulneris]|uniref:Peroxin-20 n=1 Tax=Candidozyma haemuli TaxID=45357 RepID=A0A2V1APZ6_9ASCO|nr:hypothetical protein CXQ85_003713 [[Candida] haemuloni]KAF3992409.1 hypothetical protein FT662_01118 [[Candida] haemuloni var. vulneris]KAF3995146.1 hypothetical protein FT663_00689 [[Candida] haemuloni var. vulneris]PVH19855.1 hypothetical protein CXQ85_003713 [[Candida] haemuloni]